MARPGQPTAIAPYDIAAALLLSFAGIVVPFVGWVAGAIMVWLSRTWKTWEKLVATLAPLVTAIVAQVVMTAIALATGQPMGGGIQVFGLPVVLGGADAFTLAALVYLVTAASGIWLLFRARRAARPDA